jgi:hypothetical protein
MSKMSWWRRLIIILLGGEDKTARPASTPATEPAPTPTPTSGPTPVKLAHGVACHVPAIHKRQDGSGKGLKEKIYSNGPFRDVRLLANGPGTPYVDDVFINDFVRPGVHIDGDTVWYDDVAVDGYVYGFEHISINTSSNKTFANPATVTDHGGVLRIWTQCYKAA